jgi:hypothetical protein
MSDKIVTPTSLSDAPVIAIRRATERDRGAVERLAALDSSPEPRGTVMIGEVDGQPWAALSLDDGRAVADPFRRSADVVALLRAHAREGTGVRRARPRLALRWAG